MPVEVTAAVMADTAGMLLKDMLPQVMLRVDTLVSVLAVDVVTNLREPGAAMPALQGARVIGMAAVIGEAVTGAVTREAVTGEVVTGAAATGEAVTGIRILGSAITAWAMAIHPTVTHTTAMATHTTDITLTATDTGRP
jgi:hypothetical protein